MKKHIVTIIEAYGMTISPKEDINTSDAMAIIKGSQTKMEMVGNSYLYGYMKGRSSGRSKMVPVLNVRQMTDDEWSALAARNKMEREALV